MKKFISFLLVIIAAFVVASCSNGSVMNTNEDLAEVSSVPLFATAQAVNTTVNYSISKNGSKWVSFPVSNGVTYTLSASDMYGYTGTRPSHVLDLTVYKTESTSGTKLIATWYNITTDGTTTPDAKSFKATYTGTAFFYIKEINRAAGTTSVKISGGSSTSSSSSSSSSSTTSSSSSTSGEAALGTYSGKVYVSGNAALVTKSTSYGLVLMGGGSEDDNAIKWMITKSGGGDFVVLRADDPGKGSYAPYIYGLGGVDSCHEVVISSTTLANSTYVDNLLRSAEAVFIAGGDQNQYRTLWNGTKVETALSYLANTKKIPIGGTSAGCHALGGIMYSPTGTAVISSEALANPYHTNMNVIVKDFLAFPLMTNIITDTHWSERDRLGRTITLLARVIKDGTATLTNARAIAVDECTAVAVDASGAAKVFGGASYDDYAYFFKPDTTPNTCTSGSKLNWTDAVTVYKVKGSATGTGTQNISTWSMSGGTSVSVNVSNGVVSSNIQTPN